MGLKTVLILIGTIYICGGFWPCCRRRGQEFVDIEDGQNMDSILEHLPENMDLEQKTALEDLLKKGYSCNQSFVGLLRPNCPIQRIPINLMEILQAYDDDAIVRFANEKSYFYIIKREKAFFFLGSMDYITSSIYEVKKPNGETVKIYMESGSPKSPSTNIFGTGYCGEMVFIG